MYTLVLDEHLYVSEVSPFSKELVILTGKHISQALEELRQTEYKVVEETPENIYQLRVQKNRVY